jgi:Zn-dependent protease
MSLLAPELAHSIVARRHGLRVQRITLWLLGGTSELVDEPRDASTDLRVALAGPATSAGLGVGILAVALLVGSTAGKPVAVALVWLAVTNVILAVFNLLPGAPLDGGRVLRALVWRRTGDRLRAATAADRSGRALGLALMLLGIAEIVLLRSFSGLWLMLLGWFLRTAADAELADSALRHRLGDTRLGEVMTLEPVAVPASWPVSEFLGSDGPHTGHRVFPVIDAEDRPVGVVTLPALARLPESTRARATIGAVATPLPPATVMSPDDRITDALTATMLRPGPGIIAVVDASGRLVGLVAAADLQDACDRSALGLQVGRRARPEAE